jgi:hypothetical protein
MPVRLPIAKLAASAVAPLQSTPSFSNALLQSGASWPQDVNYLRDVYMEIYAIWDRIKAPEQDKELYTQTEPHLRELVLGLEDVSKELSTRTDIMRDVTNAHHDFDVAESYGKIGDYGLATVYQSYSMMKLHRILDTLTLAGNKKRGSVKKLGYGYDTCLAGDTKISLLNGTEAAIADLVGRDKFWVYSLNDKGLLRPGLGHSAYLTLKNAAILAVTLDNGEVVKCTLTHPFLMRNGEYKAAELLIPGDSLMPLYRSLSSLEAGGNEYQTTYQPGDDSWRFTHRFVEARCPKGYVRHHDDLNRFINRNVVNKECLLCAPTNHKVISVVPCGTADVYDFTVEKYHNFALSAGVFVHNSGEVFEQGGTSGNDEHLWDRGNSPEFEHTPPNPVSVAQDFEAEEEFPELAAEKHKRVEFPARTR